MPNMIPIGLPSRWICSRCIRDTRILPAVSSRYRQSVLRRYSTDSGQPAEGAADLDRVRNIGIIAHIDAGKTTTTERMLYYSGVTRRIGNVDDGSTVTDFLPAERARGITIQSAAITFDWPPRPSEQHSIPTPKELTAKGLPRSAAPHTVNLIDTPGHADFTFEVLRSLRILDGAVCILDGVAGVEAQTEKVWNQASTYHIPRIVYINKLDRDGAAFGRTVQEVGSKLDSWPAVCQIPWFESAYGRFQGVGDAISLQGLLWQEGGDGKKIAVSTLAKLEKIDEVFACELKKARVALVELLSEHDEVMVENFLEHNEDHLAVKPIEILESLRRCLLDSEQTRVIPVFAGASFRNIGVQPLLDQVVNLLPSPKERPDPEISIGPVKGGLQSLLNGDLILQENKKLVPEKKKKKHVSPYSVAQTAIEKLEGCALAFKVVSDAKRGVLVYVRVYSGSINRSASLFNTHLNLSERAPRLLKMYASEAMEVQSIPAGHIGVIVGLKYARTGDTLLSYPGIKTGPPEPLNKLQLRPIAVPPPVFFASLEPHSLSEEKHLHEMLALLLREDPSLHVTIDEDSGQTLLSGMGELHLEIARDRLVNDFKAKVTMGQIEIGYRECISETSPSITRVFDREIAGRKGKAGCAVVVEPFNPDEFGEEHIKAHENFLLDEKHDGNRITILAPGLISNHHSYKKPKVSEDILPSHLDLAAIKTSLYNGCLAALSRGPKNSFPLHNTHVTVTFDLNTDLFGNETTPSALSAAARLATQSALKEVASTAVLMEPVMHVTISVPETNMGVVVHDISSARGGHILSLDDDVEASSSPPASSNDDLLPIDVSKIYVPPDQYGSTSTAASNNNLNPMRTITAKVPLKEMVGYLKHLRSLTGGRGTFVMSVDRFEKMGSQRERAVLTGLGRM
ncbi:ribosome-releasing factor 2, mitochondrial [Blastomyces dermatitidis ER-3]|uniref:Ribosome-releasing factor 2, mitochondrial n=2 Tax=Ajellomyces dermatitidis TaxID=5039 RepID=F2TSB0_AJEDA|nr:ribosome-releasing factor 2, mitochondrial [Blastomyces dermatitidis ER-3]EEQ84596.2 ribosome-releasing factor 2, mitochondrial [Blastomyces dermatitidis ER-3]EGE86123.2 ribosome-releasing factor 2, mitochondrial [Blastomyces dermatitidis ATCC 18188]